MSHRAFSCSHISLEANVFIKKIYFIAFLKLLLADPIKLIGTNFDSINHRSSLTQAISFKPQNVPISNQILHASIGSPVQIESGPSSHLHNMFCLISMSNERFSNFPYKKCQQRPLSAAEHCYQPLMSIFKSVQCD